MLILKLDLKKSYFVTNYSTNIDCFCIERVLLRNHTQNNNTKLKLSCLEYIHGNSHNSFMNITCIESEIFSTPRYNFLILSIK